MDTTTATLPEMTLPPCPIRRFTVDEYHLLLGTGIFDDDGRFELLEGWIILKPMTRYPPHDGSIDRIQERLREVLPPGWRLRNQSAITLGDSEPEPDLALVRDSAREYLKRDPGPGDIALAIEVSDSTLDKDRRLKARIYARAGIPFYWIVNVAEDRVEVHADPSGPAEIPFYRTRTTVGPEGEVRLIIDGQDVTTIPARDVLP